MNRRRATTFGAAVLALVIVAVVLQVVSKPTSNMAAAIGGQITIDGCSPKSSEIVLLARRMKGESSATPQGVEVAPTAPTSTTTSTTLPETTSSLPDTTTTTFADTTTTTTVLPTADPGEVTLPAVETLPPRTTTSTSTTTTTSPPSILGTTTTSTSLFLLTTTTLANQGLSAPSPREALSPATELAASRSVETATRAEAADVEELKAKIVERELGVYDFAFTRAVPGVAYQLGGLIRAASCDGASWRGPTNGLVIADDKGKLQAPIEVSVAPTLRVYANNSEYSRVDGKLRQHWQRFDAVDVRQNVNQNANQNARRIFRWELPAGLSDAIDWQVSLLPFASGCDLPPALVASGTAEHLKKDDPNSPANVFDVDFSGVHRSLFRGEEEGGGDGEGASSEIVDKLTRKGVLSMFDGTYYVRILSKRGEACVGASNAVAIRELETEPSSATTTVEVDAASGSTSKSGLGKPSAKWEVRDKIDWTTSRGAKRSFHWTSNEPDVAAGELQIYKAGDDPKTACADPRSLLAVSEVDHQPVANNSTQENNALFEVNFHLLAKKLTKKLDKSQAYSLRVVPLTESGACAGLPSNTVALEFGAASENTNESNASASSAMSDQSVALNIVLARSHGRSSASRQAATAANAAATAMPEPTVAPTHVEVIGYAPLTALPTTSTYCYRVVEPFAASDAAAMLRAFEEKPAFLPTDEKGAVSAGTRLCFTPAVPREETNQYFGALVGPFEPVVSTTPGGEQGQSQFDDTALATDRSFALHPLTGVPEVCPANACVSEGRRLAVVELSVTRDPAASTGATGDGPSFTCVTPENSGLYEKTCVELPAPLEPGKKFTVPVVLGLDLFDEMRTAVAGKSNRFVPPSGSSLESWARQQALESWRTQMMDTHPSISLTTDDGAVTPLVANQPWGTLADNSDR